MRARQRTARARTLDGLAVGTEFAASRGITRLNRSTRPGVRERAASRHVDVMFDRELASAFRGSRLVEEVVFFHPSEHARAA
jgi:hypothetical protein